MQVQISAPNQLAFNINLVRQRQYLEALDRYKDYLAHFPDHLALILIDLYKQVIRAENSLNIRLIIAELYIKHEYYDEAYQELEEMYETDPHFSQTFFLAGKIYNRAKNKAFILPLFKKAFESGNRDSVIIDLLPKIYLDHNDITESIHFFETLTEENTHYPHYKKVLAELYRNIGAYDKSVTTYTALIDTHPEYVKDACKLCESILLSFPHYASVRKEAIHFFTKDCDLKSALYHLEQLHAQHAHSTSDIKDIYTSLLDIFPGDPSCLMSTISFLVKNRCYTDVIAPLESLIKQYNKHDAFIEDTISSILKEDPEHVGIRLLHMQCLFIKKEHEKAITLLKILLQSDSLELLEELKLICLSQLDESPQKSELCICLAQIFYKKEKYIDALNYCNQSNSSSGELSALKASILLKQNKVEESERYVQQQLKHYPHERSLHNCLYSLKKDSLQTLTLSHDSLQDIMRHLLLGNTITAIEFAQKITADNPDYAVAQLLLTRAFLNDGKYSHALQLLTQLTLYLDEQQSQYLCPALFLKAICHYSQFEFDAAIKTLNTIEQKDIQFPFYASLKTQLQALPLTFNYGYALTGLIDIWNNSIRISAIQNSDEKHSASQSLTSTSFGLSHANQGTLFMIKDNLVSAESELKTSIQLDSKLTVSHNNLALLYLLKQDHSQAESFLSTAFSLNPSSDIACVNKGLLAFQQNDPILAIKSFQKALSYNPHNLHAQFNLAMMYFLENRLLLCFQYLNKLNDTALLFLQAQESFHYLSQDSLSFDYWLKPPTHYGPPV